MMTEEAKKLAEKSRYDFSDLVELMRILRAPGGCPWDRAQTHESIRRNLIEETYEVVEAIDNGDRKLMREELGDLLMQVVFHAEMAKEDGEFDIGDVIHDVTAKLVYRHPHIFKDVTADTTDEVLANWEQLKNKEKKRKTPKDRMDAVPPSLPALMRADKVSSVAGKYGFDFPDAADAMQKIDEELAEVKDAGTEDELFEEVGDLLFSTANFARKCGFSAEEALDRAVDKFRKRFLGMNELLEKDGKKLEEVTLPEMDSYWNMAKMDKKR